MERKRPLTAREVAERAAASERRARAARLARPGKLAETLGELGLAAKPVDHRPKPRRPRTMTREQILRFVADGPRSLADMERLTSGKALLARLLERLAGEGLIDVELGGDGQTVVRQGRFVDAMSNPSFARLKLALDTREGLLHGIPPERVAGEVAHRNSVLNAAFFVAFVDPKLPDWQARLEQLADEAVEEVATLRRLSRGSRGNVSSESARFPGWLHDHLRGRARKRRRRHGPRRPPQGSARHDLESVSVSEQLTGVAGAVIVATPRARQLDRVDTDKAAKQLWGAPNARQARRHARELLDEHRPTVESVAAEVLEAAHAAGLTIDQLRAACGKRGNSPTQRQLRVQVRAALEAIYACKPKRRLLREQLGWSDDQLERLMR